MFLCVSLAIFLTGCAGSSSPPAIVVTAAPPMPRRVVEEAQRPPVSVPVASSLDSDQTRKLVGDLRVSELRYRRAAVQAVRHHDATRKPR